MNNDAAQRDSLPWLMKRKTRDYRPEYGAWKNMLDRCTRSTHKQWMDYGGRGIKVCAEWTDDFWSFLAAVGPKPSSELTLDRLDNDKGYEPGNVAWRTRSEQQRNQRRHKSMKAKPERRRSYPLQVEIGGRAQTYKEWAAELGCSIYTVRNRIKRGDL